MIKQSDTSIFTFFLNMMEIFVWLKNCNYVAKLEKLHEFAPSFLESDQSQLSFFIFYGYQISSVVILSRYEFSQLTTGA